MNKSLILFIGNYFGINRAWEEIPIRISIRGLQTMTTSKKTNRFYRFLDMINTTLKNRDLYDLAIIDVFSGNSFYWVEAVATILRLLRKPFMLVLRGGGLVEFSTTHMKRVKGTLIKADTVVSPSKYLQKGLTGIRSNIIHIPNGLNLDGFTFKPRNSIKPKLVWVRALHQIYQPQMAVQALELVKGQFPDIHLTLAGQDKKDGSREIIQELINNSSLELNVSWIGCVPRSEVPAILNQGDIFLNTTNYEGFGTSVLEAAACGLCIVTTNVGELPYMWEDGVDALLVPPNDPEAMAAAIKRILTEPEMAARMSANARKKAEKYDWNEIIPQWEDLIEKVIHHA